MINNSRCNALFSSKLASHGPTIGAVSIPLLTYLALRLRVPGLAWTLSHFYLGFNTLGVKSFTTDFGMRWVLT